MKFFTATVFSVIALSFAACKKDICATPCQPENPVCSEVPPTNELCAAYFTRWFYDANTNSCKQVSYSGCSPKGFATKEECEACKCNN